MPNEQSSQERTEQQQREEQLTRLLRRKAQRFLDNPGVVSVGVGYRVQSGEATDELCIQFTVEKKLSPESLEQNGLAPLPTRFIDEHNNSVPVDVLQRSYTPSLQLLSPDIPESARRKRRTHRSAVQPGISVAHRDVTAGTLGAIVYDNKTGAPYMLSNWHVLHGPGGKFGDSVLQPSSHDGGSVHKSVAGQLVRSHLGLAGDCAVASIQGRAIQSEVLDLHVTPTRIGKVNLGDEVVKSGRTTGVTHGIVRRVGVVARLSYGPAGFHDIGGFEIGPNPAQPSPHMEISAQGDSGSAWLIDSDPENADVVVGLHFAGESTSDPAAEHALACNIHSVLDKLDVSLRNRVTAEAEDTRVWRQIVLAEPDDVPLEVDPADEPPFSLHQLSQLEERLRTAPKATLSHFRRLMDDELTVDELESAFEDVRLFIEGPRPAAALEAIAHVDLSGPSLPPGFSFPIMDLDKVPIDPRTRKFEKRDWLRWIFIAGGTMLTNVRKHPFPDHSKYSSRFEYPLNNEPTTEHPVEIAVFSDFGTGLYHSRYIAKQFSNRRFPYAIHCGDVYYAGRRQEFDSYMNKPLSPILDSTGVFLLNSNHEMYSGGKWYFDFLHHIRTRYPGTQRQEGSYFALQLEKFQIVGIDTAYHDDGRFRNAQLRHWLEERLVEGRRAKRSNILLSANQPYEYNKRGLTDLLKRDLRDLADRHLIDLWFWGNTHYCALFNYGKRSQFIGSCVGHGGFPYKRIKCGGHSPAPVEFVETAPRFPVATGLRQGRGNNGYCVMALKAEGDILLRYVDWMGYERGTASLTRNADGRLTIGAVRKL